MHFAWFLLPTLGQTAMFYMICQVLFRFIRNRDPLGLIIATILAITMLSGAIICAGAFVRGFVQ